jgi:hypothetical protein
MYNHNYLSVRLDQTKSAASHQKDTTTKVSLVLSQLPTLKDKKNKNYNQKAILLSFLKIVKPIPAGIPHRLLLQNRQSGNAPAPPKKTS